MSNPVSILEQIQKLDLELVALEREEEGYRSGLENAAREIERLDEEITALTEALKEFDGPVREAEAKIRESDERIKRDEGRLGEVRNDKEYKALNKEINSARRIKRQKEQELSNILEKVTARRSRLEALEREREEKREEKERLARELDERKPGWERSKAEKARQREAVSSHLKPEYLKRYETIKARRGGLGLVPARDETCLGCHMHIPPQMYVRLKMHTEELISCPHCHRLLYLQGSADTEAV